MHSLSRFTKAGLLLVTLLSSSYSFAATPTIEQLSRNFDIVWVVLCGVLVFIMQAGFALIESGSVRSKNTVNVLMKNYIDTCVGGLVFWLIGFGLMFGTNTTGWMGTDHFAAIGLGNDQWHYLFFQIMFAATSATIVSGAMAERMHFLAYVLCTVAITSLIYPIFGSWAWGGLFGQQGWLKNMGFIDFAGSTVVHSIGGWVSLAGVMMLGPRLGRFGRNGQIHHIPGHNLTLVALGGFLLWFGWFGFNAGSTLAVDDRIGQIALNTHLAACSGAIGYLILARLRGKAILLSTTINSSLGGLVAVTAGCATMSPLFAVVTGLLASLVYQYSSAILARLQIDDVVDAVSVHMACGVLGTLLAGVFYQGDLFNSERIIVQFVGVTAAAVWGFSTGLVLFWLISRFSNLRVEKQHEQRGLDYTEHAELAYPEFQKDTLLNLEEMTDRH